MTKIVFIEADGKEKEIEKLRNQKSGDSLNIHPKPRWSLESI